MLFDNGVLFFQPCNNPACLYLHNVGAEEDSFGKDEIAAVHTRYKCQSCQFLVYCIFLIHLYKYWKHGLMLLGYWRGWGALVLFEVRTDLIFITNNGFLL